MDFITAVLILAGGYAIRLVQEIMGENYERL